MIRAALVLLLGWDAADRLVAAVLSAAIATAVNSGHGRFRLVFDGNRIRRFAM